VPKFAHKREDVSDVFKAVASPDRGEVVGGEGKGKVGAVLKVKGDGSPSSTVHVEVDEIWGAVFTTAQVELGAF